LTIEETFNKIYADGYWGSRATKFYSGVGSDDDYTDKYCELIRAFIATHHLATVIDLGCGDFRVGRRICSPSIKYVGIDVVSSLIDHLKVTSGSEKVTFLHLNIVEQAPPSGDLCLIREVLQHLSNNEIEQVLRNVQQYKYVIVSEHIPRSPEHVNLDKRHGPDTRLSEGSGVFLEEPPFSLKVETLLEIQVGPDTMIRTMLLRPSCYKP